MICATVIFMGFHEYRSLTYPRPAWLKLNFIAVFVSFKAMTENTLCVGVSRVGADDQRIVTGTLSSLAKEDLGPPLHSLVIVGKVHPIETDMLKLFTDDRQIIEDNAEMIS